MKGNFGFKTLAVGLYEANCTILWNGDGKALIVDPGDESDRILSFIESNGLKVAGIFLTHGHFDHISGVDGIVEHLGIAVAMHKADEALAFSSFNLSVPGYSGMSRSIGLDFSPEDGKPLQLFPEAMVIHTPGHSQGSCCLYFAEEGLLVAGDTLFAGSIGRTDFPGGSESDMTRSLARLGKLPDETIVISGHGPSTTIGREKVLNVRLAHSVFT